MKTWRHSCTNISIIIWCRRQQLQAQTRHPTPSILIPVLNIPKSSTNMYLSLPKFPLNLLFDVFQHIIHQLLGLFSQFTLVPISLSLSLSSAIFLIYAVTYARIYIIDEAIASMTWVSIYHSKFCTLPNASSAHAYSPTDFLIISI